MITRLGDLEYGMDFRLPDGTCGTALEKGVKDRAVILDGPRIGRYTRIRANMSVEVLGTWSPNVGAHRIHGAL